MTHKIIEAMSNTPIIKDAKYDVTGTVGELLNETELKRLLKSVLDAAELGRGYSLYSEQLPAKILELQTLAYGNPLENENEAENVEEIPRTTLSKVINFEFKPDKIHIVDNTKQKSFKEFIELYELSIRKVGVIDLNFCCSFDYYTILISDNDFMNYYDPVTELSLISKGWVGHMLSHRFFTDAFLHPEDRWLPEGFSTFTIK